MKTCWECKFWNNEHCLGPYPIPSSNGMRCEAFDDGAYDKAVGELIEAGDYLASLMSVATANHVPPPLWVKAKQAVEAARRTP